MLALYCSASIVYNIMLLASRKYIAQFSHRRFAIRADSEYTFSLQPVILRGITVSEPLLVSKQHSSEFSRMGFEKLYGSQIWNCLDKLKMTSDSLK